MRVSKSDPAWVSHHLLKAALSALGDYLGLVDISYIYLPKYDLSMTICKVSFPVLVGERRRLTLARTEVSRG